MGAGSGERVPAVERVEQSGGSPVSRGGCIDGDEACEVRSGSSTRHKSGWRGEAREVLEMGLGLHAAAIDSLGGERSWI
jgi:hypothetical protein